MCFLLLPAMIAVLPDCTSNQNSSSPLETTLSGSEISSGLRAGAPAYVVMSSYEGRKDVIKVNGAEAGWAVATHSLADYKNKEVTIELSVDVKREGAGGDLLWQINMGNYPIVTSVQNARANAWNTMTGSWHGTPTGDAPVLYLSTWENNASTTTFYIANFTITVKEGDPLMPDFTLTPLKTIWADKFPIGNILDYSSLGKYFELIKHHYSVITTTSTYSWMLQPSNGNFDWTRADNQVELVLSNGMAVHGHCLLFPTDTMMVSWQNWMTEGTAAEIEARLRNHVTQVLTHFKGKIPSWDVVNEAIRFDISNTEAAQGWRACLQNTGFNRKLGPDFIEKMFRYARAADPDVKLYYNETNLYTPAKLRVVVEMITEINDKYRAEGNTRPLIEGIGMQSHLPATVNINNVRNALEQLKTLGLEIAISELDASFDFNNQGPGKDTVMSEQDEIAQGRLYAKLLNLYQEYPEIKRVTMWGMDDGKSWVSSGNPCLFDSKLRAKKAFYAFSDPDGFLAEHGN